MGIGRATRIAGVVLAAAAALSGCGGTAPGRGPLVIGITERDFHIAGPDRVPAGPVTLRVHNAGPDVHELIVAHISAARVPLRSDGLTVDEAAIERRIPGSVDAVAPGHNGETHLRLRPGRYLLFCNMAGHFRGGMHRELVVS